MLIRATTIKDRQALNAIKENTWDLHNPNCFGFIMENSGFILAHVFQDYGEIIDFWVDEKQRNLGIGGKLLQSFLNIMLGKTITLEVAADNYTAIKLYHKFAFQVVGKRLAYYKDGQDALILSRSC